MLSDDYYYVQVNLTHLHGDTFTIERWLDDPYPNESGHSIIKADTGDGTFNLGPFYIQEGSWKLTVKFADCIDTFDITPPYFCSSSCNKFYRTTINNVLCRDHDGGTPTSTGSDDTWSFDIKVLGTTGTYSLSGGLGGPFSYNTTHTIYPGTIGKTCLSFTLDAGGGCTVDVVVCPPKPCSSESQCNLEVNLKDVSCTEDHSQFYIDVDTSRVGSGYLCANSYAMSAPTTLIHGGTFSNPLGPFNSAVFIVFKICSTSACDCDPTCFKVLYFPKPDCDNLDYRSKGNSKSAIIPQEELIIIPNPLNTKEMILRSSMKYTNFEFYNSSSELICHGSFTGAEYRYAPDIPAGLYIVKYTNNEGKYGYIKLIKL
jgi:hypothetical protein